MHFKNVESFKEIMIDLNQKSIDDLEKWITKHEFNNSMYLDSTSTLDVPDPAFRAVLNKDQLYVVGDKIRKITEFNELAIGFDRIEELENIDWENSQEVISFPIKEGNFELSKIKRANRKEIIKTGPYDTDPRNLEPWFQENCVQGPWGGLVCNYDSRYSGTDFKNVSAHLEVWNRTYAFYASTGIRIKGRKLDRRWRDDAMTYASIAYEAKGTAYVTDWLYKGVARKIDIYKVGFVSGENKKEVDKTISWFAGTGVWHDMDYIKGDFTYRDEEGRGLPTVYRYGEVWNF